MKKIILFFLTLTSLLLAFASCGGNETDAPSGPFGNVKTLGDLFKLAGAESLSVSAEGPIYAYGFEYDGVYYRAVATLSEDTMNAYYGVDVSLENSEELSDEILSPVVIDKIENLSETIIPQNELDLLVGKTGQDLLDDGWTGSFYDYVTLECGLNKGVIVYTVCFDGEPASSEDVDGDEFIKPLTVKSIEFYSIGDVLYGLSADNGSAN